MIDDNFDDGFGLGDADDQAAKRPPAFLTEIPAGRAELFALEAEHLDGQRSREFQGATEVIFTAADDGGVEFIDPTEASRWREIMKWPNGTRLPTLAEVERFRLARSNALHRAHWDRLGAAVAKDIADTAAVEQRRIETINKAYR